MIEPNCQPLRAGSPACLRRVERLGGGYGGQTRAVDVRTEWLEGLPSRVGRLQSQRTDITEGTC
jgi:hypothetical protein